MRLKLNMIVRPGIVIKSLMNIRTKNRGFDRIIEAAEESLRLFANFT